MYQTRVASGLSSGPCALHQILVTTWLYGDDLSKQVKDMTEVNKVGQRVAQSRFHDKTPSFSTLGERGAESSTEAILNEGFNFEVKGRLTQFKHLHIASALDFLSDL